MYFASPSPCTLRMLIHSSRRVNELSNEQIHKNTLQEGCFGAFILIKKEFVHSKVHSTFEKGKWKDTNGESTFEKEMELCSVDFSRDIHVVQNERSTTLKKSRFFCLLYF
jgi:hypothetical protein